MAYKIILVTMQKKYQNIFYEGEKNKANGELQTMASPPFNVHDEETIL